MEKHDRLRRARIKAGFASAADAARRLNVSYGTYSGHENGSRGIKDRDLIRYSKVFGVGADWLLFGTESNFSESCLIYSIGRAGHIPDGKVELHSADTRDRALIFPPYFPSSTAFIEVSGNYIRGIAEDGWIIFCDVEFVEPHEDHVGSLCLCRLDNDEIFIRNVFHSHIKDHYNLEAPLFPVMRNKRMTSVAPIYAIMTDIMLERTKTEMKKTIEEAAKILQG